MSSSKKKGSSQRTRIQMPPDSDSESELEDAEPTSDQHHTTESTAQAPSSRKHSSEAILIESDHEQRQAPPKQRRSKTTRNKTFRELVALDLDDVVHNRTRHQPKTRPRRGQVSPSDPPAFYEPCRRLALKIRSKQQSVPFHEAVDYDLVSDYTMVIKRPMDMLTIYRKMEAFRYQSADEIADDFRTMFQNALEYEKSGLLRKELHPMPENARFLLSFFNTEYSKLEERGALGVTRATRKDRKSQKKPSTQRTKVAPTNLTTVSTKKSPVPAKFGDPVPAKSQVNRLLPAKRRIHDENRSAPVLFPERRTGKARKTMNPSVGNVAVTKHLPQRASDMFPNNDPDTDSSDE